MVDHVEILLFHTPTLHNFPSSTEIKAVKKLGDDEGLSYSVHLPTSLEIASRDREKRQNSVQMAIELINQFAGCRAPGAIITGDTDPDRIREASRSGYPLLHKPVDVDALRGLIEDCLGWARPRSA